MLTGVPLRGFPMLPAALGALLLMSATAAAEDADGRAKRFIEAHEQKVRPLEYRAAIAWWNANTTGKPEEFKRKEAAQNALDAALADRAAFKTLDELSKAEITEADLRRQVTLLRLMYLEKQVDPALLQQMSKLSNKIEQAFNAYRANVDGVEFADSKVRDVLKTSKDVPRRRAMWVASKGVGAAVETDLLELVRLRNKAATALGFKNYHVMMLALNEQDQGAVLKLFDELDQLTRGPFLAAKNEIDDQLAASYKTAVAALRPWHYHDPFFQESPAVFAADLDAPYRKTDILKVCRDFYRGIGLPVDDVLVRSDLYEKPGKSPHAFCTDIDREGDVRILANVVPNEYWMGTMLHELGHAVYTSKNIPASVPYVLRGEAHILTTEGVAMQFERFSKSATWLAKMNVPVANAEAFDAAAKRMRRNRLLIFSRWCQVMLRFEKELYGNPEQNLNKLWWDLCKEYQGLTPPEDRSAPDYASKIHVVSAPCYYHNYMMGELFACQVHEALCKELYPNTDPRTAIYFNDKRVGRFMTEKVFAPGKKFPWNELTKHATGKPLGAEAFAADFKD